MRIMTGGTTILESRMDMRLTGDWIIMTHQAESAIGLNQIERLLVTRMRFPVLLVTTITFTTGNRIMNKLRIIHSGMTTGGYAFSKDSSRKKQKT